ncbi:isopentenyl-diphosphate Delta-isomerase 1 [Venturia canescens]|uniref:isopentenyl-diphosphate Delta-isomerase 1 n=1 Tax=Venturia canescens TaxID=32260 RepID=UPI001C9D052F|nr:isopentenyl-diphosphate Delta-isomerase 1 [Venturia canescens]
MSVFRVLLFFLPAVTSSLSSSEGLPRVIEWRKKRESFHQIPHEEFRRLKRMTFTFGNTVRKSGIIKEAFRAFSSKLNIAAPIQEAALDEKCILVDEFDRPRGEASKRECHQINERGGDLPLHRGFSVFLFDTKGNLLLQKRASTKITFPSCYTNTCCSHPLAEVPGEDEEHLALGVKRAAQRRLNYELGIPKTEAGLDEFKYLTRIHYRSLGDGKWGEHEIDYVLFLKKKSITLDPNPDEVSEIHWVAKDAFPDFIKDVGAPLTPWFQLMLKYSLPQWWENLDSLEKCQDHVSIQRFL